MRFSPFNPIHFTISGANRSGHGEYVRTFVESDCIMLEVFGNAEEELPTIGLYDAESDEFVGTMYLKDYTINSEEHMGLLERSGLFPGHYYMTLGDYVSECFDVVSANDSGKTVLIQYADRNNRQRDDVLNKIFGGIRYFSLRIPGGFKDSGWVFNVENEQFRSPASDPVELSAIDYTDKLLTIGSSSGIDVRTADLVNRILSCPLVFIDGVRYARSEGASLERQGDSDRKTFVYTVLLREAHYLNAEMELALRLNLRRTPDTIRRAGDKPRRYS